MIGVGSDGGIEARRRRTSRPDGGEDGDSRRRIPDSRPPAGTQAPEAGRASGRGPGPGRGKPARGASAPAASTAGAARVAAGVRNDPPGAGVRLSASGSETDSSPGSEPPRRRDRGLGVRRGRYAGRPFSVDPAGESGVVAPRARAGPGGSLGGFDRAAAHSRTAKAPRAAQASRGSGPAELARVGLPDLGADPRPFERGVVGSGAFVPPRPPPADPRPAPRACGSDRPPTRRGRVEPDDGDRPCLLLGEELDPDPSVL